MLYLIFANYIDIIFLILTKFNRQIPRNFPINF